jgi:hypothetical protein
MKHVVVKVELTDAQAYALAQFLKRVGLTDYRPLAIDHDEAYTMLAAGEAVRAALREVGYAPR